LWTGKTTHIIKQLKPNEIRKVVLKAVIPREGIYNLNRFHINIKQTKNTAPAGSSGDKARVKDVLLHEFRLKDLMMARVIDEKEKGVFDNIIAPSADHMNRRESDGVFADDLGKV